MRHRVLIWVRFVFRIIIIIIIIIIFIFIIIFIIILFGVDFRSWWWLVLARHQQSRSLLVGEV